MAASSRCWGFIGLGRSRSRYFRNTRTSAAWPRPEHHRREGRHTDVPGRACIRSGCRGRFEGRPEQAQALAEERSVSSKTIIADLEQYTLSEWRYDVAADFYMYRQRDFIPQIKRALKLGGVVLFETFTVDLSEASGEQGLSEGVSPKANVRGDRDRPLHRASGFEQGHRAARDANDCGHQPITRPGLPRLDNGAAGGPRPEISPFAGRRAGWRRIGDQRWSPTI